MNTRKISKKKLNSSQSKNRSFTTGKYFPFLILRKTLSHEAPLLCLVFISKNSVSLFSDNIHTSKPLSNIKMGKVVSLAEAAKGSFVFQQGKPCPCQARQHRLVARLSANKKERGLAVSATPLC